MSVKEFSVGSRRVGPGHEPFIIAEMSGNHNGSLERAKEIVRAAAECGVDCLKFQTYTADTITMRVEQEDFVINDSGSLWAGRHLHDLYDEAHTPWAWHEELFAIARELGVMSFSSPFDDTAVDFLEDLDVPMYKVASLELTHLPLIRKIARTGKPMIMSTGMASKAEVQRAIDTARAEGATDICILKCTSAYPALPSDANLATIPDMIERYGVQVGLSDHTLGIGVPIAAVTLGATVIEKHFTLDRNDGGVDSAFSLEPEEMRALKVETTRAWQARGEVTYGGTSNETKSRQFRQSVWPTQPIRAGEKFSADKLKICRPGYSVEPRFYEELLNRTAGRDYAPGERLDAESFGETC